MGYARHDGLCRIILCAILDFETYIGESRPGLFGVLFAPTDRALANAAYICGSY